MLVRLAPTTRSQGLPSGQSYGNGAYSIAWSSDASSVSSSPWRPSHLFDGVRGWEDPLRYRWPLEPTMPTPGFTLASFLVKGTRRMDQVDTPREHPPAPRQPNQKAGQRDKRQAPKAYLASMAAQMAPHGLSCSITPTPRTISVVRYIPTVGGSHGLGSTIGAQPLRCRHQQDGGRNKLICAHQKTHVSFRRDPILR